MNNSVNDLDHIILFP